METFANIQDVIALYRPLTPDEMMRTEALLVAVSARLRREAVYCGRDLDQMIADDTTGALAEVAKSVTVDIVARALMTPTTGELGALSQYSQSGQGYTFSGTFASGGGGIYIKKAELEVLGLKRPRYKTIDLMGDDTNA